MPLLRRFIFLVLDGFFCTHARNMHVNKKGVTVIGCNPLNFLARPVRLERTTCGFEVRRSILTELRAPGIVLPRLCHCSKTLNFIADLNQKRKL